MKVYTLKLLSPLYYRSRIDSGAAGATVTSPWIGDLALMYAINNSLGLKHINFKYAEHAPTYREIIDTGIFLSVATPKNSCVFTKVFDIATSFMADGYPNTKAMENSKRAPMRNWNKRQGLEPGNEFIFVALTKNKGIELPDHFTVRLGNTKECLAECDYLEDNRTINNVSINAYTLNLIYGHEKLMQILSEISQKGYDTYIENNSSQYILIRNFPLAEIRKYLMDYN